MVEFSLYGSSEKSLAKLIPGMKSSGSTQLKIYFHSESDSFIMICDFNSFSPKKITPIDLYYENYNYILLGQMYLNGRQNLGFVIKSNTYHMWPKNVKDFLQIGTEVKKF